MGGGNTKENRAFRALVGACRDLGSLVLWQDDDDLDAPLDALVEHLQEGSREGDARLKRLEIVELFDYPGALAWCAAISSRHTAHTPDDV